MLASIVCHYCYYCYYHYYSATTATPDYTVVLHTTTTLSNMGFMLRKPDDAAGSATPAILIGLFVAFGGVLFG